MQAGVGSIVVVVVLALVLLLVLGFGSLEYQEYGLNYSWVGETVEDKTYTSGRYYLGLGNHFIKFPKMVNTVLFSDDQADKKQGPALQSRTRDGLNVRLEVSFQYRLLYEGIHDLYVTLGEDYEPIFLRMAIEQLSIAATEHDAHFFFTNRSSIGQEMHDTLNNHFKEHAFSEVPFFQLRTVHLPQEFEEALKNTQVKQQEIEIAALQQKSQTVTFKTRVLQAEQAVKVLTNQADAEAASILAETKAYCKQTKVTQDLQTNALTSMVKASGWNSKQLLKYMRIRAVRDHPADKSMISM